MIQDPEAFFVTVLADRLPGVTVVTVADSETETQLPLVIVTVGGGDELADAPYGTSAEYPLTVTSIAAARAGAWTLAHDAHNALLDASDTAATTSTARLGVVTVESLPQRTGTTPAATQITGSYGAWAAPTL